MIEGYDDIVREWSAPGIGHRCCNTVTISPAEEMDRWAVQQTITILANADYYYTKAEVDSLLKQITVSGVTREQVTQMINAAIQDKADKAELAALQAQIAQNTRDILDRPTNEQVNNILANYYNKIQVNSLFANYTKVEDTTLLLNAEDIQI